MNRKFCTVKDYMLVDFKIQEKKSPQTMFTEFKAGDAKDHFLKSTKLLSFHIFKLKQYLITGFV